MIPEVGFLKALGSRGWTAGGSWFQKLDCWRLVVPEVRLLEAPGSRVGLLEALSSRRWTSEGS